jgi:predicted nuclease of predicted toxin-antitoxin system
MRFLTDQDVYAKTIRLLEGLDHDVATVKQLGIAQADDESIIQAAQSDKRILVTRDRDFGVIVNSSAPRCRSNLPSHAPGNRECRT